MKITKRQLRRIIREKFAREDFRDVYATAQMAHVGQKRRSGEDYFSHPSEVRNIVRRFYPKDRVSELAALLHDSLEDAPGSTVDSPEEMEEFIRGSISDPASGDEVIRVVRALTHEKGGDYQSYVVDLMNDQPALRVKLADMVHNLSSSPSPKQKLKYKSALDAIGAQTGGQPPAGISQKHWGELQALTEGKQVKITKRQLKNIIQEALRQHPHSSSYSVDNILTEGFLDWLGGLWDKLTNWVAGLAGRLEVTVDETEADNSKAASSNIAQAASDAGRDDVKKLEDLNLENDEDRAIFWKASMVRPQGPGISEVMELLNDTDKVTSWTPKSDSEADNKAWEKENGELVGNIWEAHGLLLGSLKYLGKHGIKQAADRVAAAKKSKSKTPADEIKVFVDTLKVFLQIWGEAEKIDGVDGVTAAWKPAGAKLQAIAKKLAADGKKVQESLTRRTYDVKVTEGRLRSIIRNAITPVIDL